MTIAEATLRLRQSLGLSRVQFAKLIENCSAKTIQRVESGSQASLYLISRLVEIARDYGQPISMRYFESNKLANLTVSVDDVRGTARRRRVPLSVLKSWSAALADLQRNTRHVLPTTPPADLFEHLRMILASVSLVRDEIEILIAEPPSITRIEENAQLLKDRERKAHGKKKS
jgi:transcriptional regulator with XRE-family HTH domain